MSASERFTEPDMKKAFVAPSLTLETTLTEAPISAADLR
ncbi:MAG: hypothetical protein JWM95_4496 [Gemmatimonadetes bacterium]|nr:hypothetical protein [Gemmatimonadota bacterium]